MKKYAVKALLAYVLVMLLIPVCIAYAVPANAVEGDAFTLDMTAEVKQTDPTAIDVVITVRNIKQELDAVEFILHFDPALVEGVITSDGDDMDALMSVKPMYTMSIAGMELPASRYEQICTYDGEEGVYECRFLDSLRYTGAKPGETYRGLIRDGDLVITVPFRIVNITSADAMEFRITGARGTTRDTFFSVTGAGDTARVEIVHNQGGPGTPTPVPTEPPEETVHDVTEPTSAAKPDPTVPTSGTAPDPTVPTSGTAPDPTAPTSGTAPDPTAPTSGTAPDPTAPTSGTAPDPMVPTSAVTPGPAEPTIPPTEETVPSGAANSPEADAPVDAATSQPGQEREEATGVSEDQDPDDTASGEPLPEDTDDRSDGASSGWLPVLLAGLAVIGVICAVVLLLRKKDFNRKPGA